MYQTQQHGVNYYNRAYTITSETEYYNGSWNMSSSDINKSSSSYLLKTGRIYQYQNKWSNKHRWSSKKYL